MVVSNQMVFALLFSVALARKLPIYQSYEVQKVIDEVKGKHPVYLLVLFKDPSDLNETSAAFTRFIDAIPIPMNPHLGIVVDPTILHNQLIYSNTEGRMATVNFSYRFMMRSYQESKMGINRYIKTRLNSILNSIDDARIAQKVELAGISKQDKELEAMKQKDTVKAWKENLTAEVNMLVHMKNEDLARLVKHAVNLQKELDNILGLSDGSGLPAFDDIDPRNTTNEVTEHSELAKVARIYNEELERTEDSDENFDEDAIENDDVEKVDDDEDGIDPSDGKSKQKDEEDEDEDNSSANLDTLEKQSNELKVSAGEHDNAAQEEDKDVLATGK